MKTSLRIRCGGDRRASRSASGTLPAAMALNPRLVSCTRVSFSCTASSSTTMIWCGALAGDRGRLAFGKYAEIASISAGGSIGFTSRALNPASVVRDSSRRERKPESARIGSAAPGARLRSRCTSSRPSMSGRIRSCRTRSGRWTSSRASAVRPSPASSTRKFSLSSVTRSILRVTGLSSMTRIVGASIQLVASCRARSKRSAISESSASVSSGLVM